MNDEHATNKEFHVDEELSSMLIVHEILKKLMQQRC